MELKSRLTRAPILALPQFTADAAPFLLQTDASAVGLGAVDVSLPMPVVV